MNEKVVVETIYGNKHKYEIIRTPGGILSSSSFSIYRDGEYYKGSFSSLSKAVDTAKKEP